MDFTVRKIDEKSFYVFTDPARPTKVKKKHEKEKSFLVCPCYKFEQLNTCDHVTAVMDLFPEIDWKVLKIKQANIAEYIGGDARKNINNLLKSLTF